MKVKIVEFYITEFSYDSDYDYCSKLLYSPIDASDWENITDDELVVLQRWAERENRKSYGKKRYTIVTETNLSPLGKIKEFLAVEKKEQARQAKIVAERKALSAKKALEKKKKQLEKLKAELGA